MNRIISKLSNFGFLLAERLHKKQRAADTLSYMNNGRRPWSRGYEYYKEDFILSALNDENLIQHFRQNQSLPDGYGMYLDERVVEYPWVISRLNSEPAYLLDAGSVLNYHYIISHRILQTRKVSIITLAPEVNCFSSKGRWYPALEILPGG